MKKTKKTTAAAARKTAAYQFVPADHAGHGLTCTLPEGRKHTG